MVDYPNNPPAGAPGGTSGVADPKTLALMRTDYFGGLKSAAQQAQSAQGAVADPAQRSMTQRMSAMGNAGTSKVEDRRTLPGGPNAYFGFRPPWDDQTFEGSLPPFTQSGEGIGRYIDLSRTPASEYWGRGTRAQDYVAEHPVIYPQYMRPGY